MNLFELSTIFSLTTFHRTLPSYIQNVEEILERRPRQSMEIEIETIHVLKTLDCWYDPIDYCFTVWSRLSIVGIGQISWQTTESLKKHWKSLKVLTKWQLGQYFSTGLDISIPIFDYFSTVNTWHPKSLSLDLDWNQLSRPQLEM